MLHLSDKQIEKIKKEFPKTTGGQIRAFRKEKNRTQIELAIATGKDRQYIYKIEKGIVTINVATLKIILIALGVSLSDFFKGIDSKT